LRAEVFERLDYDTVVVLDSHWAITVKFVVTAQNRRVGLFSEYQNAIGAGQVHIWFDRPAKGWT
jgi:hypothetical protein